MPGAGNQVRTGDLNLGKVALYQLSYSQLVPAQPAGESTPIDVFKNTVRAVKFSENGYSPYIARVSACSGLFE